MLHLPSPSVRWTLLAVSAAVLPGLGCRQPGTPNGYAGAAPLTSLPGQTTTSGPLLPSLGPFGASARVPPPSTGSYGATAANMSLGQSNASANGYAPAGYAPAGVQPMSYEQPVTPSNSGGSDSSFNQIRSGGMQVIDLTNAASPPDQAAWGQVSSAPAPASPVSGGGFAPPVSGGEFGNSAPAANQPAFSTADRPLQWQAPRR